MKAVDTALAASRVGRLLRATAMVALSWIVACGREEPLPPLVPAAVSREQRSALQHMNDAGRREFAGWTWNYQFGAGCTLRVRKSYKGLAVSANDHPLASQAIEIVAYGNAGFGVKARAADRESQSDLYGTMARANAEAFAADTQTLLRGCAPAARAAGVIVRAPPTHPRRCW